MKKAETELTDFDMERLKELAKDLGFVCESEEEIGEMLRTCVSLAHASRFDASYRQAIASEVNDIMKKQADGSYRQQVGNSIHMSLFPDKGVVVFAYSELGEDATKRTLDLEKTLKTLKIARENMHKKSAWIKGAELWMFITEGAEECGALL